MARKESEPKERETPIKDITVLGNYSKWFHPAIPKFRQGKYVQVVVLRETKSHAIFTTEGQTLDVEHLQAGVKIKRPIDRIVMYKRKQIAPERRTGKALMRQFGMSPSHDVKDNKGKVVVAKGECQLMGNACGVCPDCILYGFAATAGTGSQRARVLTDSGFVVREQSQVMRDIKLNAIQETTAGGIAGAAYASRENVLPQVFIPTVETLVDVTPEEFVYVLGNILSTTRYGAEQNREGFVRNHVLGIYFSNVEVFSNLELTQRYYDALAQSDTVPDYLCLDNFTDKWSEVAQPFVENACGVVVEMPGEEREALLADVRKLYRDEARLATFLKALDEAAARYARETKKGEQPAEESE
ncbi:MAG: type I-D CRISPR-associated protein Cas7/Csc2 [Abditibacteriales bacterium]|nr:type I-D CRISPR-associated protein Cas7/Csc2 [Abditibacteriales bacterium]